MPYRPSVERGYPLLSATGRRLAEHGVHFHDLTMLFSDVEEPLYLDSCCHLNAAGNARLGHAIGAALVQDAGTE